MRIALAVAAAAVACGMTISPELSATNAILDAARTPAVAAFRVSDLTHPITIEPDTSSRIDRTAILRRLFATITKGATGDQEAVVRVAAWVQDYFVHPMTAPRRRNGQGVYDPLQLLRLRRAQCGLLRTLAPCAARAASGTYRTGCFQRDKPSRTSL